MARILAGGFTAYTEDTTQTKSVTSPIGTPNISATAITLPPGEDAKNFVRADIFNLSFSASSVVDADGLATSAFWTYGDTQVNWTIEYRADSDSAWATDTSDAHTLPFEVGTSDQMNRTIHQLGPQCLITVTKTGQYRAKATVSWLKASGRDSTTYTTPTVTVSAFSGTTYYIDAVDGDDLAAGTSEETAWKTGNKALTLFADLVTDTAVLFKRGGTYDFSDRATGFKRNENFHVGAYGTGAKPILRATAGLQNPLLRGNIDSGTSPNEERLVNVTFGNFKFDGNDQSRGFLNPRSSGGGETRIDGISVYNCEFDNITEGSVDTQYISVSVGQADDTSAYKNLFIVDNIFGSADQHEVKQYVYAQMTGVIICGNRFAGTVIGAAHGETSESQGDLVLNHRIYINGGEHITLFDNDQDYLDLGSSTGNTQCSTLLNAGLDDGVGKTYQGVFCYYNRASSCLNAFDISQSQFRRWSNVSDVVQSNPTEFKDVVIERNLVEAASTTMSTMAFLSTMTTWAFRHNVYIGSGEAAVSLSINGEDVELKYDADELDTPGSGEDFDPYSLGRIHNNIIVGDTSLSSVDVLNTGATKYRNNVVMNETPDSTEGLDQFSFDHVAAGYRADNDWYSDSVNFRNRVPPSTPISTVNYAAAQNTFETDADQSTYATTYANDSFAAYATTALVGFATDDYRLLSDLPVSDDGGGNGSGGSSFRRLRKPVQENAAPVPQLAGRSNVLSTARLGIDNVTEKTVGSPQIRGPFTFSFGEVPAGQEIRYTTNNRNPNSTSKLYTGPIRITRNLTGSDNTVIKARYFDPSNPNFKSKIIRIEFRVF
mgnify:CR=1 FL=1